jgi:hypothetical protein
VSVSYDKFIKLRSSYWGSWGRNPPGCPAVINSPAAKDCLSGFTWHQNSAGLSEHHTVQNRITLCIPLVNF